MSPAKPKIISLSSPSPSYMNNRTNQHVQWQMPFFSIFALRLDQPRSCKYKAFVHSTISAVIYPESNFGFSAVQLQVFAPAVHN